MIRHTDRRMLSPRTEPTLLSALQRHWRLAAAMILGLCVLLVVIDLVRPARYVSSVDVVLREPAGGAGFDAERFAADQVNIMTSPPVSSRAIEILKSPPPEAERAGDPVTAVWAANSIVDAYDQTVRQTSIDTAKTVRESFDDVLAEIERQLIEIDRVGAAESDQESERASLVAQQANILARISDLNVEAALNARPIALRPDVVEAERSSLVNARALVALAILGTILATAVAYLLDRRTWATMHPHGPPQAAALSRPQIPALQPGQPVGLPAAGTVASMSAGPATIAMPASQRPVDTAAVPQVPVGIAPLPPLVGATALTAPRNDAMFAPPASPARPLMTHAGTSYGAASPNGGSANGGPPPIQRLALLSSEHNLGPTLGAIRAAGHQVVALASPANADRTARTAANLAIAAAQANYDVGFVSSAPAADVEQLFSHLAPAAPPTDGSVWAIPVAGGSAVRVMKSMQAPAALTKFVQRMRGSLGESAVGPALLVLDLGGLEFVTGGSEVAAQADAVILVLPSDNDAESERVYRRFLESKRAAVLGVVHFDSPVGALNGGVATSPLNGDHRGV